MALSPEADAFRREWEKRPRLLTVTPEAIAGLSDRWLEQALLEFVWAHDVNRGPDLVAVLQRLPPGFRAIYGPWLVDSEVANGGFHQYFWNHGEELVLTTEEALGTLGASEHQAIFVEALAAHRGRQQVARAGLSAHEQLQAFSDDALQQAFEDVDKKWDDAPDLEETRRKYIRAQAHLFVARLQGWQRIKAFMRGAR